MKQTILWHDYETWGVNPQKDFPCQFAGIRTDLNLNIVGKPLNWFSQIPNDYLPHPQACLVTGITPQQSLRDGMVEAAFMQKVLAQMSQANTCTAGYNSLRFDDEVTRFSLYRNLQDPYAREWKNGNSRWDIIDLVRTCYALRPEGLNWVYKEDGRPSFKLDELAPANGIEHEDAHDALSDVYATIGMAKKIKEAQPKLYQFAFDLRDKRKAAAALNIGAAQPVVHISSKLPATQGCCTWILPIAKHPKNNNAVICLNLALSPEPLFDLSAEELHQRLYTPLKLLANDESRLPIKLVHINKCPIIAPAKTLTEENAQRLGIDRAMCLTNLARIKQHPDIDQKLIDIFLIEEQVKETTDPDFALYSGGFISDSDRQILNNIVDSHPNNLDTQHWQFTDSRLEKLVFRFRARNYPQTLSDADMVKWQRHREYRLTDPNSPASIKMNEYMMQLEQLAQQHHNNPQKQAIIRALFQYAEGL